MGEENPDLILQKSYDFIRRKIKDQYAESPHWLEFVSTIYTNNKNEVKNISKLVSQKAKIANAKSSELALNFISLGNIKMKESSQVTNNDAKKALISEAICYFNQAERKVPVYAAKLEKMTPDPASIQLLEVYLRLHSSRAVAYFESKQTNLYLSDAQKVINLSWLQEMNTASETKQFFKYKTSQSLIQTLASHAEALFQKAKALLFPVALKKDDLFLSRHDSYKEQELEKISDKGESKQMTATSMLGRAEFYLLYEAYWDWDYPEKVLFLKKTYCQYLKKIEKKKVTTQLNVARAGEATSPTPVAFTNLFGRVKLVEDRGNFTYKLTARRRITAGQVIFYEKVLALQSTSSKQLQYCGLCHRTADRFIVCPNCSGAVFCGSTCQVLSQKTSIHASQAELACPATANLSKLQLLALELISGFTFEEAKVAIEEGFKVLTDGVKPSNQSALSRWRYMAMSALFMRMHGDANFGQLKVNTAEERELVVQAFELLENSKQAFSARTYAPKRDIIAFLYKLLYMLRYSPLAQVEYNMVSGKNGMKKPALSWTALGGFGGLLGFSCQPNVQRRFNAQFGNIEYIATRVIQQDEDLLLYWWGSKGDKPKLRRKVTKTGNLMSKPFSPTLFSNANAPTEQAVSLVEQYFKRKCTEKVCKCN